MTFKDNPYASFTVEPIPIESRRRSLLGTFFWFVFGLWLVRMTIAVSLASLLTYLSPTQILLELLTSAIVNVSTGCFYGLIYVAWTWYRMQRTIAVRLNRLIPLIAGSSIAIAYLIIMDIMRSVTQVNWVRNLAVILLLLVIAEVSVRAMKTNGVSTTLT